MIRFLFFTIIISINIHIVFAQDAIDITKKSLAKIATVKTASFTIDTKEYIGNKYHFTSVFVKKQNSPLRIYLKIDPGGKEVLINEKHKKTALVNPNGFPWANLELDPYGNTMHEGHHHSIYETGFHYFAEILAYILKKYEASLNDYIHYEGEVVLHGKPCFKIKFESPDYKNVTYTLNQPESLLSIATRMKLNKYKLLTLNPFIDSYTQTLKAGTKITITTDYASLLILYVEKATFLPARIDIFDNQGLFEQYDFKSIVINPAFTETDFSEDNKNYGF